MKLISLLVLCLTVQSYAQDGAIFNILMNDAPPDTLGDELLTNGSMELNSNWTGFGTEAGDTVGQSSAYKHSGTYSWKVDVDAGGEGVTSDNFSLTAGSIYYLDFWVYRVASDNDNINIAAYFGSYTLDQNYVAPVGVWTRFIKQVTASGTGNEKFFIRSVAGAAEFYLDDVSVKQKIN